MKDAIHPTPPTPRAIASICRCSSPQEHADRASSAAAESSRGERARVEREAAERIAEANKRAASLAANTPKADEYVIERVERIGDHLAMQVRYPSCKACSYEGVKTMVFLDVPEHAALKWKRIDPHFRIRATDHLTAHPTDAPSPAARFPSSKEGWSDAVAYAKGKAR